MNQVRDCVIFVCKQIYLPHKSLFGVTVSYNRYISYLPYLEASLYVCKQIYLPHKSLFGVTVIGTAVTFLIWKLVCMFVSKFTFPTRVCLV